MSVFDKYGILDASDIFQDCDEKNNENGFCVSEEYDPANDTCLFADCVIYSYEMPEELFYISHYTPKKSSKDSSKTIAVLCAFSNPGQALQYLMRTAPLKKLQITRM